MNEADVKTDIEWIKKALEEIKTEIKNNHTEAKTLFADKWVEWPVRGIVAFVCLAVAGALVGLVLVPNANGIAENYHLFFNSLV